MAKKRKLAPVSPPILKRGLIGGDGGCEKKDFEVLQQQQQQQQQQEYQNDNNNATRSREEENPLRAPSSPTSSSEFCYRANALNYATKTATSKGGRITTPVVLQSTTTTTTASEGAVTTTTTTTMRGIVNRLDSSDLVGILDVCGIEYNYDLFTQKDLVERVTSLCIKDSTLLDELQSLDMIPSSLLLSSIPSCSETESTKPKTRARRSEKMTNRILTRFGFHGGSYSGDDYNKLMMNNSQQCCNNSDSTSNTTTTSSSTSSSGGGIALSSSSIRLSKLLSIDAYSCLSKVILRESGAGSGAATAGCYGDCGFKNRRHTLAAQPNTSNSIVKVGNDGGNMVTKTAALSLAETESHDDDDENILKHDLFVKTPPTPKMLEPELTPKVTFVCEKMNVNEKKEEEKDVPSGSFVRNTSTSSSFQMTLRKRIKPPSTFVGAA